MRRFLLILLSILLASGTVGGSIAHAADDCAQTAPIGANEFLDGDGCVQIVAEAAAEADKDSPAKDQPLSTTVHGCHGHHSGVATVVAASRDEIAPAMAHITTPASILPPMMVAGTFRPPIA